jgi:hypothetical protein
MGKPVWILLPHLADWRWMQQIEISPWYPTARLFRQPVAGDWASVVERVAEELNRFQQLPLTPIRGLSATTRDNHRSQPSGLIPA